MAIVVIGTGYVGLVSGACLAQLGQTVICVDSDNAKIEALQSGVLPIHEPSLEDVVSHNAGLRLHFATKPPTPLIAEDVVLLAVGTPQLPSGEADLNYLFKAADDLAPHLVEGITLVIKSTVPVGTARRLRSHIAKVRPNLRFSLISNPEFLREGVAIADFMQPDRIVLGHGPDDNTHAIRQAYAPLVAQGVPLITMSNEAAEMCKYASNTYLAMRVTFVNELANLCEAVGADIENVTEGMGLDRRIGHHYLQPGPGFGGSCFPKDTTALLASAEAAHVDFLIGHAVVAANEQRKSDLVGKVARTVGGVLTRKTIAILGLAFKANTDDVRDSASIQLIKDLQARGAAIKAYDPAAKPKGLDKVTLCNNLPDAVAGADAAVIVTEWDEFRKTDLVALARRLKKPVLVDFRNLFSLQQARAAGLSYFSVGRATVRAHETSQQRSRTSKAKYKWPATA